MIPISSRIQRVFETGGDVGNLREEDREQEHMRDIDLPDPAQDPRGRDHEAGFQHGAAIDERRGIAGDEDEDFGGVGKTVIADREPGQKVRRQMVDEDQPQRQAAKQIEPQFALADRRRAKSPARSPIGSGAACAARSAAPASGGPAIRSAIDVIWHRLSMGGSELARPNIGNVPARHCKPSYGVHARLAAARSAAQVARRAFKRELC